MTVTASSGSTRVAPQLYDTLPLSSVRQAEQQDRFPDGGELDSLITFFQTGRQRVLASQRISANAGAIVHLAGRPGDLEAALKEAGVKTFVFMGADVLSTLSAAYDRLSVET